MLWALGQYNQKEKEKYLKLKLLMLCRQLPYLVMNLSS